MCRTGGRRCPSSMSKKARGEYFEAKAKAENMTPAEAEKAHNAAVAADQLKAEERKKARAAKAATVKESPKVASTPKTPVEHAAPKSSDPIDNIKWNEEALAAAGQQVSTAVRYTPQLHEQRKNEIRAKEGKAATKTKGSSTSGGSAPKEKVTPAPAPKSSDPIDNIKWNEEALAAAGRQISTGARYTPQLQEQRKNEILAKEGKAATKTKGSTSGGSAPKEKVTPAPAPKAEPAPAPKAEPKPASFDSIKDKYGVEGTAFAQEYKKAMQEEMTGEDAESKEMGDRLYNSTVIVQHMVNSGRFVDGDADPDRWGAHIEAISQAEDDASYQEAMTNFSNDVDAAAERAHNARNSHKEWSGSMDDTATGFSQRSGVTLNPEQQANIKTATQASYNETGDEFTARYTGHMVAMGATIKNMEEAGYLPKGSTDDFAVKLQTRVDKSMDDLNKTLPANISERELNHHVQEALRNDFNAAVTELDKKRTFPGDKYAF